MTSAGLADNGGEGAKMFQSHAFDETFRPISAGVQLRRHEPSVSDATRA